MDDGKSTDWPAAPVGTEVSIQANESRAETDESNEEGVMTTQTHADDLMEDDDDFMCTQAAPEPRAANTCPQLQDPVGY